MVAQSRIDAIAKAFIRREKANSLYITKKEREALRRSGRNPAECRLIDRIEGESIFLHYEKVSLVVINDNEEGGRA